MASSVSALVARGEGEGVDWRLATPLGLVYLGLFAGPLLLLLGISFFEDSELAKPGLASWQRFWGDAFYRGVVVGTLRLGLMTVAATTLLAYPLALVFCAAGPRAQKVLIFVILLPLLTSVVIRTFAWIVILAREGVINNTLIALGLTSTPLKLLQSELGLVMALTQIEMPLMLLPLLTVMRQIDPNLVDASRALGASRWRTFFRVIMRNARFRISLHSIHFPIGDWWR
jgi:putative spermidine/putrescine transport system permease protein